MAYASGICYSAASRGMTADGAIHLVKISATCGTLIRPSRRETGKSHCIPLRIACLEELFKSRGGLGSASHLMSTSAAVVRTSRTRTETSAIRNEYGIPPPQNPFKKGNQQRRVTPQLPLRSRIDSPTILDAPESPKPQSIDDPLRQASLPPDKSQSEEALPKKMKNANKMPLGRPNRLEALEPQAQPSNFDRMQQPSSSAPQDGSNELAPVTGSAGLPASFPSAAAKTVWQRSDGFAEEIAMADESKVQPRIGYWERKSESQVAAEYSSRRKKLGLDAAAIDFNLDQQPSET